FPSALQQFVDDARMPGRCSAVDDGSGTQAEVVQDPQDAKDADAQPVVPVAEAPVVGVAPIERTQGTYRQLGRIQGEEFDRDPDPAGKPTPPGPDDWLARDGRLMGEPIVVEPAATMRIADAIASHVRPACVDGRKRRASS